MAVLVALPDEAMRDAVGAVDSAEIVVWNAGDEPPTRPIDLLVLPYVVTWQALGRLVPGDVRYVQGQALGYDGVRDSLPPGIAFCNAVGVHEAPTAELAMTLILASQRGWPEVGRNQVLEAWERPWAPGLIGSSVVLIGIGGIGREFEKRIEGFGASVLRVGRTAREGVHATSELPELLPTADIVVLAVPLGEGTRGLVDDAFLDLLPTGALVVNVSRGPVIDTDALVRHVRDGRVRAALDVVDPEPLPVGHPLWSLPGSLISPHVGGQVLSMSARVVPLVRSQIERLANGEQPDHIVVTATGEAGGAP